MKSNRFSLTCLTAVLFISLLAACSSNGTNATKLAVNTDNDIGGTTAISRTRPNAAESVDSKKYAIIFKVKGNPYGEKMMDGFKTAVEEMGQEAIMKAPGQPTAEAQIQIIEELILQKVDAIAIAANDPDALQPALVKAKNAGIQVLSLDSAVNAKSRMVHVNQTDPEGIGRILIQGISKMIGGVGQIAVLSTTSQATNQNAWIAWMKKELEKPEYSNVELIKVVYGDDLHDKSVSEIEGLLKSFPNLKGIIAPTTVGIAAAGKVLTDKGLKGQVHLTGLGLPSEMAEYIKSGICEWMYLWNPNDLGYLAGYTADTLVRGFVTGAIGDKFNAGIFREKEVIQDGEGTQIIFGDPFKFDLSNIAEWKGVY